LSFNLSDLAVAKGFSVEELQGFGVTQDGERIAIPCFDSEGNIYRTKYRTALEGSKRFTYDDQKDKGNIPYGLNRPVPIKDGKAVWIVEGESDCWALWLANYPAIGIPGATSTACLLAEHASPAQHAVVVKEPGEAGDRFPFRVAQRLYETGFPGIVYSVTLGRYKDPLEAFHDDRGDFKNVLLEAWKHREAIPRPKPAAIKEPDFDDVEELTTAFDGDENIVSDLIEGMLPKHGAFLLGGKKKAGKSVILGNITRCVVLGEPFLERHCQKATVLYGSFDESKSVTLERFEALGLKGQPGVFLWANRASFGKEWPGVVRKYIEHFKPGIFVCDTLAKLAGIREINSYGEWNLAFQQLHAIADEYGVAIIVTAHSKKEGHGFDAIAGSSGGLGGNVDTTMIVERDENDVRTIATEQRSGDDMPEKVLRMDPDTFLVSIGRDAWVEQRRSLQQAIIDAMGHEALGRDEIISKVGRRALDVKRALSGAVDAGWMTYDIATGLGHKKLYQVISRTIGISGSRNPGPTRDPLPDPAGTHYGPTVGFWDPEPKRTHYSESDDEFPGIYKGNSISEPSPENESSGSQAPDPEDDLLNYAGERIGFAEESTDGTV
jgi:hypothetical protein